MGGVFLNYRTGDGDWAAALVKRELSARFGADNVFYAGQSIRLGEDFSRRILGRLRQSEVVLALIGPRWSTAVDRLGGRRLDRADDWVRREIGEAFRIGLRVIPVLLDGIDRLDEATLPDDIAQLARCQYLRMHHRSDDFDLTRLIDELIELVPGLVATRQQEAVPGDSLPLSGSAAERGTGGTDHELRGMATRLRQALSNPAGTDAAQELVQVTAGNAVDALETHDWTGPRLVDDDAIAAVLQERLNSYERVMAPLLRLAALGVCSGDRAHDELWITVVTRFLDRQNRPRSSEHEFWDAVGAYPALLLTYVAGVAGMAAGRDDLVYRLLDHPTARVASGRQVPVIRALALRHVVDPRHASALPKWDRVPPYHALSVHLRQVLSPTFFNVVGNREYECAFEDFEYLRSLLELHDRPFSSLGEFAVALDKGDTAVYRRMAPRLAAGSTLLRSGAFGGDPDQADAAWCALKQSIQGRYP